MGAVLSGGRATLYVTAVAAGRSPFIDVASRKQSAR